MVADRVGATMIKHFEGESADEVWREAAEAFLHGSGWLRQGSRLGMMREFLHSTFHVRDPRQRWILSRHPAMNPAFAIAELVWILQGRDDAGFLNYWNPVLPNFAGQEDSYYGAYGYRLRTNLGLDQIERAYHVLANKPESRQVVLQIWDSRKDLPHSDGDACAPDIPCNIVSMLKIRGGRLEWMQVMRSNDLFLGTPHNYIQFTTLQEIMAGWLGLDVGSFVLLTDSLHLYEHDIENVSMINVPPSVRNEDSLALPKEKFDRVLTLLGCAMDELRDGSLPTERFLELIEANDMPEGWRNFLYIAAADAARRRNWSNEMETSAERCTNPALSFAWDAWLERCRQV